MRLNPIRRSQLVAPFGPGALHVLEGGVAVITGGLDDWFKDRSGNTAHHDELNKGGLIIREARLEEPLGVSHFRVAPGPENRSNNDEPELVTPVFRFPTWFVCPRCSRMKRGNLNLNGHLTCAREECRRKRLIQVRFAAACDHGHLQDFPWLEWVHRDSGAFVECVNSLIYDAEGSGSLESIRIRCERCKKSRSLRGVMQGSFEPTEKDPNGWSGLSKFLRSTSDKLDGDSGNVENFQCCGMKPWQGVVAGDDCARPLRAVLINATNVHSADVRSAIHIPPRYRPSPSRLAEILDESDFRNKIAMCRRSDDEICDIVRKLRRDDSRSDVKRLDAYGDDEIEAALVGHDEAPPSNTAADVAPAESRAEQELKIRRDEYEAFQGQTDREGQLVLRSVNLDGLPDELDGFVEGIVAVEKLRETRVFAGFSRLLGRSSPAAPTPERLLWRSYPADLRNRWLPAAVVFGEGLFINFSEARISEWEKRPRVIEHLAVLQRNQTSCVDRYGWEEISVEPRFVLLHTIAHLLINRLVFECGYGSSSLRERLYVSSDSSSPMAGILIYTAAGDAEGTMGGLVRLAEADTLGRMLSNAFEAAQWCSADPVCGEAASSGGQGPESLNLAACHSCGLLPETSCEQFNRFLDRSLVLADHPASLFFQE